MKNILLAIAFLSCNFMIAQKKPTALKVTYSRSSNGKTIENQDKILVFADKNLTYVTSEKAYNSQAKFPIENTLIHRKGNILYQVAQLSPGKKIATIDSVSIGKQQFELLSETKTILGYRCKKAKTIINSNSIEIWYTNDLQIFGAPTVLGQNLGLVLEMNRNNNYVVTAEKVENIKAFPEDLKINLSQLSTTDLLSYRDVLWQSRFTTIPVFKNETIHFSGEAKSNDSILRFANGTVILKKIKFPEINPGSQIFVDLNEQSSGDAYDRTGSVFLIDAEENFSFFNGLQNGVKSLPAYENGNGKKYHGVVKTNNFSPVLELMRFFTPFGIKNFNHIEIKGKTWHEIVPYRQDISELRDKISGKEVYIGTFIGNYDKGGHKVNLNITIHPEENALAKKQIVLSLFNTTNIMEMAEQDYATMFNSEKGLEVKFTLDKNLKNVRLRYITTGHGGWENGDEFVPKKNTIILDGKEIFSFVPWRTDCGSYRLFNPASGNFANGLSSSDYSRSNWCPGTTTNPIFIDLGDLTAGEHSIRVVIPQGESEGGSFSSWNVSGTLIGE
ncbi:peptide-N-glycosidase [Flavobacterium sp. NST-5]|uniref:Peptide-N-glycosidase n=1 Tax=Flavobacterium ichthyis TaxID=2698827 RepID=A0ABW9ZAR3_9FLAO|nr:PNGase F N-terminal domain-containing protein [Flavobacterium ichthyis]NBL64407.1 peptide-N-glycosidase [Flavobacterium ichthyis]